MKEIIKGIKIGVKEVVGVGMFMSMECKGAPYINRVCKWARSSAFSHAVKSSKKMLRGEGSIRNV
jgi:hypothetical protein